MTLKYFFITFEKLLKVFTQAWGFVPIMSTWETEAGVFLSVQGSPGTNSEFKASLGYTERNRPKPNKS